MHKARFGAAFIVLSLVLGAVFSTPSAGQGPVSDGQGYHVQSAEEALLEDAREYASRWGVSVDEALHIFELTRRAGEMQAELEEQEKETFAGLWVEHTPRFRVVVLFTRDGEKTIRPYANSQYLLDVIEVRSAQRSLAELVSTQVKFMSIVRDEFGMPVSSDTNVYENRVEIYVLDKARLLEELRRANVQLPDFVQVIETEKLDTVDTDIFGGLQLDTPGGGSCTSGFAVQHADGRKGILTAGHCSDTKTYNGVNLPWQEGHLHDSYDTQWHTAPGFVVRNWIVIEPWVLREINSTKGRANQVVGEEVCKYGITTGKTCGNIVSRTYAPTYVRSVDPTFIRVHRDGVDQSEPGDSGGPWYKDFTAYGISSGEVGVAPDDAIYMPINYIDIMGVNVMTAP